MDSVCNSSRAGGRKRESEGSEAFFNVLTAGFSTLALALESGLPARLVSLPFINCLLALTGNSGREVKLNIFHEAALIEYNSRKASEPTQRNAHFHVNLQSFYQDKYPNAQGHLTMILIWPYSDPVKRRLTTSLGVGGVDSLRLSPLCNVPSIAVPSQRPSRLFWINRPTGLLSPSLSPLRR